MSPGGDAKRRKLAEKRSHLRSRANLRFRIGISDRYVEAVSLDVSVVSAFFVDRNAFSELVDTVSPRRLTTIRVDCEVVLADKFTRLDAARLQFNPLRNGVVLRFQVPEAVHDDFVEAFAVLGKRIDRFDVQDKIGSGGFGRVYRARDPNENREVALKVVSDRFLGGEERCEILLREARIASGLNDPRIVTVYQVGRWGQCVFIAMELIEGPTLRQLLEKGPLSIARACGVAEHIARALAAAHSRNVVHRDLKPENVILASDDRVKVVDFGLAIIRPVPSETDATKTITAVIPGVGSVAGTPLYMAPEQFGGVADVRSDIFALGAVLYELIAGVPPFYSDRSINFRKTVEAVEPLPPRHFASQVPEELESLVLRCLAKSPSDRYQDAGTIARQLESLRTDGHLPSSRRVVLSTERFSGRCFHCDVREDQLRLAGGERSCQALRGAGSAWPETVRNALVSILPEWTSPLRPAALPPIDQNQSHDVFVRWADDSRDLPPHRRDVDPVDYTQWLPYRRDFLREECGVRCGSPLLYRGRRFEEWLRNRTIYILDMSTYGWSRTLKDPRSWAIINFAVENGLRHLATWTAGNAGYSLAMLASHCNHFLHPKKRLRIYALCDEREGRGIGPAARSVLESWGCRVVPIPDADEMVLNPDEVRNRIAGLARAAPGGWSPDEYWDVTDGWEAVGLVMYRLILAQAIFTTQPSHAFVPVGTGNLALGAVLAARDCEANDPRRGASAKVIGAFPDGNSVLSKIPRLATSVVASQKKRSKRPEEPLMPKLRGPFTPLLACIDAAMDNGMLGRVDVSRATQFALLQQLSQPSSHRGVRIEPSAMAGLAALKDYKHDNASRMRALVVCTGFGLIGPEEKQFVSLKF